MENGNQTSLEKEANAAFEEIVALRHLSKNTGTITLRTQNKIFQQLSPGALARVAVRLKQLEDRTKPIREAKKLADEKGGQQ